MPGRPLPDVLREIDYAHSSGKLRDSEYVARKKWAQENAENGRVDFPDAWLRSDPMEEHSTTPATSAPTVSSEPGEAVASVLRIIGGLAIAVGLVTSFGMFVAASEIGSTVTHTAAITALIQGVVSGVLLLAVASVIDLLRQISARLASGR